MNDAASKLFNEQTEKLNDKYNELSDAEKKSFVLNIILVIYFLMIMIMMTYLCQEVKEGKGIKTLTPNKH